MTTYVAVDFPPPMLAGPACQTCEGRGVTGQQAQMETGESRVLLVDVFCSACGGCGQAEHDDCVGPHAALDGGAGIWDVYDDAEFDEEPDDDACPSCQGREWNAVQGFDDPPTAITVLRVPCGCTTTRARTWTTD